MEFPKYIVPICVDDDYRGNGFIVNKYLILPYHLIKKKPNSWEVCPSFYFQYDRNKYRMETSTNIVCQGGQIDSLRHPNLARDLLVFKAEIVDSDLSLALVYDVKDVCEYYGYNVKDGTIVKERKTMGFVHQQKALSATNGQPMELDNCMTCKCKLEPGNSGGLVCQGDNIIGMFIRDQSFFSGAFQSVFIKASYIVQTIEKEVGLYIKKKEL